MKDMLLDLGLNKNTLSTMYNGSMLKGDSLARIADYLDLSLIHILSAATSVKGGVPALGLPSSR